MKTRVFIGITGASGTVYAVRIMQYLSQAGVELHVAGSHGAILNAQLELDSNIRNVNDILGYAKVEGIVHDNKDIGACVSSGSFKVASYLFVPSSAGFMCRVASGISDTLLTRTADVALKERRKLIICLRETPLNLIHINAMQQITLAGGVILPLSPGFYTNPNSIEDLIEQISMKIIDQIDIEETNALKLRRWGDDK